MPASRDRRFLAAAGRRALQRGPRRRGTGRVDEGLAHAERTIEGGYVAELHRVRGELLHCRRQRAPRKPACARRSTTRAQQQARSFELRAATALARLLLASGREPGARAVLAPVYDWFTEGHETADLVRTRTLCPELDEQRCTVRATKLPTEAARRRRHRAGTSSPSRRGSPHSSSARSARGTHTKGVCARAEFEVFDVAHHDRRPRAGGAAGAGHLREARGLSGHRPVRERRVDHPAGLQARRSRAVVRRRRAGGVLGPEARSRRLLDEQRVDVPHQRRARIRRVHAVRRCGRRSGIDRAPLSMSLHGSCGASSPRRSRQTSRSTSPASPIQQMRYWSNVPFSHGPDDAVKYSAIPASGQSRRSRFRADRISCRTSSCAT